MTKPMTLATLATAAMLFTSLAQASGLNQYHCEIQQLNFEKGEFIKRTFAQGNIDPIQGGQLIVDMPRYPNITENIRVILTIGPSYDRSKLHIGFTGIDKHGSTDSARWDFALQVISEFEFGAPSISIGSTNSNYMAEFTCKLQTL